VENKTNNVKELITHPDKRIGKPKPPDFFDDLLSEEEWLIRDGEWGYHDQQVMESQFTSGNGYIGSRGVLEEIPRDSFPGTYVAGIYDGKGPNVVLVNLPNPVVFQVIANREKLNMDEMDVLHHERILDTQKAVLIRKMRLSSSKGEIFDYHSLRFLSMRDPHAGMMRIHLTPLSNDVELVVNAGIDTSVGNQTLFTRSKKRRFNIVELGNLKNINYLCIETLDGKHTVGYATSIEALLPDKSVVSFPRSLRLKLKKNQMVCFTKTFSIYTSREVKPSEIVKHAINSTRKTVKEGFSRMLNYHVSDWQRLWEDSDIKIESSSEALQKALRFNVYHLLISGNKKNREVSVPARALSGEGYRGHIFWDAEIFVLPFFLYTNPKVARNMLWYRYHTLDAARANAKMRGFKGAMFPWESADTGEECTPLWVVGPDGKITKIRTGELEHHISADIAYTVYQYYLATEDEEFMSKAGYEIILETARFWTSRVRYDPNRGVYHIDHVIGPDEFHIDVNDNTYTNIIARQNLLIAYKIYKENIKKASFRKLVRKLKISREVDKWKEISEHMFIPKSDDLIEAFEDYFKKEYVPIQALDDNFMPLLPPYTKFRDIGRTQFVKQADTIMSFHLFPADYPLYLKKENFSYYYKRTLHKSSLSAPIYASVGWQIGEHAISRRCFFHSLYTDLRDMHGNTRDGIHVSSMGGTWQAIVYGFAGMKIIDGLLTFDPYLPPFLDMLKFKVKYRGTTLVVTLHRDKIEVLPLGKKKRIKIKVYNKIYELQNKKICSSLPRVGGLS